MRPILLSEQSLTCQQNFRAVGTGSDRETEMYANTVAAITLDHQRAAELAREVELRRRHAERFVSAGTHPTAFAVVTDRFTGPRRHTIRGPQTVGAH